MMDLPANLPVQIDSSDNGEVLFSHQFFSLAIHTDALFEFTSGGFQGSVQCFLQEVGSKPEETHHIAATDALIQVVSALDLSERNCLKLSVSMVLVMRSGRVFIHRFPVTIKLMETSVTIGKNDTLQHTLLGHSLASAQGLHVLVFTGKSEAFARKLSLQGQEDGHKINFCLPSLSGSRASLPSPCE